MLDLVSHPRNQTEPEAKPRRIAAPAHAHAIVADNDLCDLVRADVDRHGDRAGLLPAAEGMDDGVCHRLGERETQVVQEADWDTVLVRELHRGLAHASHLLGHRRDAP